MKTAIIVAAAENNAIGRENKMPWHLSDDLKYFKAKTSGHAVIMGRKTYESLGRPLPGRLNIIITRDVNYTMPGCEVAHSIEEAKQIAERAGNSLAFIIGGGEIYKEAWHEADMLYLTRVHTTIEGDTFVPAVDEYWVEQEGERHFADEKNEYDYSFILYVH
ncbi:dihydrofolate reductase [Bacteroides sp. OttesenSCG-928-F21]|nr:dihydrofolate reductase [Bacteroides sp. OttesenSCG-928-F21]